MTTTNKSAEFTAEEIAAAEEAVCAELVALREENARLKAGRGATNKTAEELAVELAQLLDCDGAINENGVALIEQALLAAEQRAQQGWRGMDSCPLNGTILVWGKSGYNVAEVAGLLKFMGKAPHYFPTRWMHLPSAPNTPDAGITATDYQCGFADGVAKVVSYHRSQFQYYSRMNQNTYAEWHLKNANTIEEKHKGETQ